MAIWKIKDTAGTTHDVIDNSNSHYVKGTQTATTNAWTGALPTGVTAYSDGLTIDYFLPQAGNSTAATLNLGGLGAKPVYVGNGTTGVTTHFPIRSVIRLVYIVDSNLNSGNGCWKAIAYYSDGNTKNTAGATDTSSKIYLIGATSQDTNPQTYSHDTAYVGTDGCLYSGSTKVSVEGHTHSYVPTTRTVNSKALSSDITLSASDVGAATSDHTHTTSLATDTGTSTITLASAGKYKLTAGGTSVIFTMPTIPTVSYPVTSVAGKTGAVTLAASDVGLGNVGNFKAVSTVASQGLTDTEKSNARANIGAGTSSLTIGTTSSTAAAGNHTHSDYASSSHTHDISLASSTGTSSITLASATKYQLTAGGKSVIFTMPTIPTVSYPVTSVNSKTGAVSLTYSDVGAASSDHTHTASLATSTGTSAITLAHGGKYALTAGGSSVIFTMPSSSGISSVTANNENIGSASAGTAIAADDITAWSAGTAPSLTVTNTSVVTGASVSGTTLTLSTGSVGSASGWSAGTVPSLSYTARSIPNISVTSKSVTTSITTS